MIIEKIKSPGLAHNSYLIGSEGEAAIIDPRRDIDEYLAKAQKNELKIKYVFETHRNEDYVIGSKEISQETDAVIYHADNQFNYKYGNEVEDGESYELGGLEIKAIKTPGHTPGGFSYLLKNYEGTNNVVFSGDTLLTGDVGRVDFYNIENLEENAASLYDSIEKLINLGDDVILCPAHGAGSVCAESIQDREWTTIGIEKKLNPLLTQEKDKFISEVAKELEKPPYVKKMEEYNLNPPLLKNHKYINFCSPSELEEKIGKNQILDTRSELAYSSGHVKDSVFIWKDGLSAFLGWFFDYERPISLILESIKQLDEIKNKLYRLGYDDIDCVLSGGMVNWHMNGYDSEKIETITVQELCKLIDAGEPIDILDVRGEEEVKEKGKIEKSTRIHLTKIQENLEKIRELNNIHIFCGSGLRSMIAASILKKQGIKDPTVVLGGLAGWESSRRKIK